MSFFPLLAAAEEVQTISVAWAGFSRAHVYSTARIKLETYSCLKTKPFLKVNQACSPSPQLPSTVEQLQQSIIQLAGCNSINFLPLGFIRPDNTHIN